MKNSEKVKKIIRWKITQEKNNLKIDQKEYIRDFSESEGMT